MLVIAAVFVMVSALSYLSFSFTPSQNALKQNIPAFDRPGKDDALQQGSTGAVEASGFAAQREVNEETALKQVQKEQKMETDLKVEGKTQAAAAKAAAKPVKITANVSRSAAKSKNVYLQRGDRGSKVAELQKKLKLLGYFNADATGFYGDITVESVKKLQRKYGHNEDGIVHASTLSLIEKLARGKSINTETSKLPTAAKTDETTVSSSKTKEHNYLQPWFGGVENTFERGETATVYDIWSGLSFNIKRTYGYNHADCETLTSADTEIMKKIYGGNWSWARRPIIVIEDGNKIAASMAGMPHAGIDNKPANVKVSWRSGGYGEGVNLDAVKNNNMDGHFDIHFYGSKTHGTNRVNEDHQNAVEQAAKWASKNY